MTEKPYDEFVAERFDAALRDQVRVVFTNRGIDHAKIVIQRLISGTKRSLRIVTGCLHGQVYLPEELRNCARRIGQAGVKVVICDPLPFTDPSALLYLKQDVESSLISVRQLAPGQSAAGSGPRLSHFIVSDEMNIRVESDHGAKTAVVILNAEKSLAQSYVTAFDKIFADAADARQGAQGSGPKT